MFSEKLFFFFLCFFLNSFYLHIIFFKDDCMKFSADDSTLKHCALQEYFGWSMKLMK